MGSHIPDIQSLRENIKKELHGIYPEREIGSMMEIMIAHRLGLKRHEISLKRQAKLVPGDADWFAGALAKLHHHCPLQYITEATQFMGMPLKIIQGVLIPRPETEELVDWIVRENEIVKPRILDIGTGSGCIALALKKLIQGSQVTGTDISESSLALAGENAKRLNLEVTFRKQNILAGQPDPELNNMDIIVSNPPYIPESEKNSMRRNVTQYEPHDALFVPDHDPMVFYRQIAIFSQTHLNRGGTIYFEIHENFAHLCRDLADQQGFSELSIRRDLNGKERMLRCRKP
jgi:release factor glutamine methyltransferase